MSNQPFTFPPPPPPPPRRAAEGLYQQDPGYHNGRGSFRGNSSHRGNIRGGRGNSINYRGGSSGPATSHVPSHGQTFSSKPFNHRGQRGGSFNGPQKRDYNAAFKQTQQYPPRPTAPPPVPDFNASIQHLLTPKPPTQLPNEQPPSQKVAEPRKPDPKRHNLLGLTPAKFEQDSDPEDDEDEEQKLATQTASTLGGHLFEYNGNPLTLRTREQIIAWIAERKRRFPTEAKRQASQKEFEEKKRLREEEMKVRLQAKREAEATRDLERAERQRAREQERAAQEQRKQKKNKKKRQTSNEAAPMDDTARAQVKAEKLREKALQAQQALEKAEEALRLAQAKKQDDSASIIIPEADPAPPAPFNAHPSIDPAVEEDETSSSGSDTSESVSDSATDSDDMSDSDSAPEVTSTKHPPGGYDPVPRPPREPHDKNPRFCPRLAKYKSCKYGRKCHFSHDRSRNGRGTGAADRNKNHEKEVATTASGNAKRKGLWQVMVDKEQDEERKRLLGAIITLGERGMLDEPMKNADGPS